MSRSVGAIAVASLFALASCGNGKSYVLLELDSAMPLTLTGFDVAAINGTDSVRVHVERAQTLPSGQTVSLEFGPTRSGEVTLEVIALSKSTELARASTKVTLNQHGVVNAKVRFFDAAASPDMNNADMTSRDLAGASLSERQILSTCGLYATAVAVADLNRDGRPDIAVSELSGGKACVFLNQGGRLFSKPLGYPVGQSPFSIVAADVNLDGNVDLVTGQGATISLLLGRGDGTFNAAITLSASISVGAVTVGRFDADNFPDIALVSLDSCALGVFLGQGSATFQGPRWTQLGAVGRCDSIVAGDINHDGRIDAVVGVFELPGLPGGGAGIFLGKGDGTAQPAKVIGTGGNGWTSTLADVNHDGNLDILSANNSDTIGISIGSGDGTFKAPTLLRGAGPMQYITSGDVDGDGEIDAIATGGTGGAGLSLFLGKGSGEFRAGQVFETGPSPYAPAVGDLDGDGRGDVVVPDKQDNNISVYWGILR